MSPKRKHSTFRCTACTESSPPRARHRVAQHIRSVHIEYAELEEVGGTLICPKQGCDEIFRREITVNLKKHIWEEHYDLRSKLVACIPKPEDLNHCGKTMDAAEEALREKVEGMMVNVVWTDGVGWQEKA